MLNRRKFTALIPALILTTELSAISSTKKYPISSNGYNWITFFRRENKVWGQDIDADMALYAQTGLKAYEPGIENLEHAQKLIAACKKHKISMPSVYVNSLLHIKEEVEKSTKEILAIADLVKAYGTAIMVTNPTPIKWGAADQKSDEQLKIQAAALDKLGAKLRKKGIKLAYHTHDMEMKAGAREFHHMMQNTAPENMAFCMDVHWIYRGCDNSVLPIFDVIKMYGHRIVELHLRQSVQGVWSETFTAYGDINYLDFVAALKAKNIRPHIVIEQCLEAKTPQKWDVLAAHKIDLQEISKTFKEII
jgi:inosose dehydratase